MKPESLTEQVIAFQEGRASLEATIDVVWTAVWRSATHLDEDQRSEFALFFHRRIRAMIHRYDPALGSFEAYLATAVRYQLKSFASRKVRERFRKGLPEDPNFWKTGGDPLRSFAEIAPEERDQELPVTVLKEAAEAYRSHNQRVHPKAFKQRLLYVTLKCSLYASEETLAEMASFLEIDQPRLLELARELADTLQPRVRRRRTLQEQQNELTCHLHSLRKELEATPEEPRRTRLRQAIELQEERFRALTKKIDHVPDYVTNREIAKLLAVPKGSVDSGIFYVRSVLRSQSSREAVAEECRSVERDRPLP
ncbi:MAG: hypothetical protein ACOC47_06455 [Alkalispirochaetaceae bacterium]